MNDEDGSPRSKRNARSACWAASNATLYAWK